MGYALESFYSNRCNSKNILVWVYFPQLPRKYWSQEILSRLASTIGKPLNRHYNFMEDGAIAQGCVIVNNNFKYSPAVKLLIGGK